MNNIPVVIVLDPWRRALASVMMFLLGFGPATFLVAALGWRPMIDPYGSLFVSLLINFVIYILVIRLLVRLIFPDAVAGNRALGVGDYQQAVIHYDKYAASLDRHPWMDHWRTVLFQDASRFSLRETAWQMCGYCCIFLGDLDRAVGYYERGLALNPGCLLALNGLNFILLFRGEPVRQQSEIMLRYAFDRGRRGPRRQVVSLISLMTGLLVMCPVMVAYFFLAADPISFMFIVLLTLIIALVFRAGWRWLAPRMFLPLMLQGFERMKAGDFAGAVEAFERQFNQLTIDPSIDNWRLITLFETSAFSYREWLLLYEVSPWVQLGRADRVITLYEECVRLNPENIHASAGLAMVRKLQAVISQKKEQSSQP